MLIRARSLHKVYQNGKQKLHVLKGIEFSLEAGEAVSIVGPSGGGKSSPLPIYGGFGRTAEGGVFFVNIYLPCI